MSESFEISKTTGWVVGISIGLIISLFTMFVAYILDVSLFVYWVVILIILGVSLTDILIMKLMKWNKVGMIILLPAIAFILVLFQALIGGLIVGDVWTIPLESTILMFILGVVAIVGGLFYIKYIGKGFKKTSKGAKLLVMLGYVAVLISLPAVFPLLPNQ